MIKFKVQGLVDMTPLDLRYGADQPDVATVFSQVFLF
jgi:hypothetical protein